MQEALLKACVTKDWTTAENLLLSKDEKLNELFLAVDKVVKIGVHARIKSEQI